MIIAPCCYIIIQTNKKCRRYIDTYSASIETGVSESIFSIEFARKSMVPNFLTLFA